MQFQTNRRRHERFHVVPGFTPVRVRTESESLDGHTYDISESGVQFELDRPMPPGTHVLIEIELPAPLSGSRETIDRVVGVEAEIVWTDETEPGPTRMAAEFTRFIDDGDRCRLHGALARGLVKRAA